jgi:hypothetical protein
MGRGRGAGVGAGTWSRLCKGPRVGRGWAEPWGYRPCDIQGMWHPHGVSSYTEHRAWDMRMPHGGMRGMGDMGYMGDMGAYYKLTVLIAS